MFYKDYINSLKFSNKSENTIRSYLKDIAKIVSFFDIKNYEELNTLSQEDYSKFFITFENLKPESINGFIRNFSAFINWCLSSQKINNKAFLNIKFGKSRLVKVPKVKRDFLTDEEGEKLLEAASNFQDKVMFLLMFFTGIRRDEVTKIKVLDVENCKIRIHGKGDKERFVYLTDGVCEIVKKYIEQRNSSSEYLFYSGNKTTPLKGETINNRVVRAIALAGITKKITAHRLRATAITRIIKQFDIYTASKAAGHSDTAVTKRYDESGDYLAEISLRNQKVDIKF